MSETRSVYVSNEGEPETGLSLTWEYLKKLSDGSDVTPQPSFTEVGGGWYKFDVDPEIDDEWTGVIDAGATIANKPERYIPMLAGDSDVARNTLAIVTPVYDEDSDTIQFMVFLLRNGQIVDAPDSVQVTVYDSTHTSQFVETGSSSTNGVFVLAKNNPGLNTGAGYYCEAEVTVGSKTFTSIETMITLD